MGLARLDLLHIPLTRVWRPYDGGRWADSLDGSVHRPPGLDVGDGLETVGVPVTVHLWSPSQKGVSVVVARVCGGEGRAKEQEGMGGRCR